MKKKIVQDDSRQDYMIKLFQLESVEDREGVDAFLGNLEFELKSTSKGNVSTARDLGYNHLEKWKDMFWIVGNFKNTTEGFHFDSFYLLTPRKMEGWYSKIRSKLDQDRKVAETVISVLQSQNVSEEVITRTKKLMNDGALLNDPNISKKYIIENGIVINDNHAAELRRLIRENEKEFVMTNFYTDVKEFQTAVGQHVGENPEFPEHAERALRMRLLEEEWTEYVIGEQNNDLENIAKELADIIYIVCGTAVSYGIPLDRVFDEVHRSNMAKLVDGKPVRREDGKILKPEGWTPPDIKKVLWP